MMVGRVTGTVVSTNKVPKLTGARMLIVEPVSLETVEPTGDYIVCVDDVGAGEGDLVFCAYGSSSRQSDTSRLLATDYTIFGIVDSLDAAISHINTYGSHHTDCIVTRDDAAASEFLRRVDSAGVYRNVSTRFADGFVYGFGAEVGIATGKIHARGPMGVEGLTTYKYKLLGSGQTMGDVKAGRISYTHRDLEGTCPI